MTLVSNNLCAANNIKNNKGKLLFQILTIYLCWKNFKMINNLLKKSNSQIICMQKIRLEIVHLQILLQSYPQLSVYLPQVNREFKNIGLCTIFGRIQILIKTKKYKIRISPRHLSIIYEVIPLHIYNEYRSNDLSRRAPVGACFCIYNQHLFD